VLLIARWRPVVKFWSPVQNFCRIGDQEKAISDPANGKSLVAEQCLIMSDYHTFNFPIWTGLDINSSNWTPIGVVP